LKILFSSYAYAPGVGGIETVSALLTREFIAAGHEIVLLTETPAPIETKKSFPIIRNPTIAQMRARLRWCEVVFQNNITLRHLIPALVARKPVLVVHQTWMRNTRGAIGWNDRIKRALVGRVKNVAISDSIARDIGVPSETIGNPYDDAVFKLISDIPRDSDIVFVGRLVSDKGVDLLLRAAALMNRPNINLTIVGSGPEETSLRALATELKLDVTFADAKSGGELAEILNHHQIIAIPSRWPEPFGIVALEGIACGCVPVGSEQGGLPEAIGPCGLTFQNGDPKQLAERLDKLLTDSSLREKFRDLSAAHLERFRALNVANHYLEILSTLARHPERSRGIPSHHL
jgi:glycogen(starch) synthase